MGNLLRIEWMKIKSYRTFWILLAIIVVAIPSYNYVIYDFFVNRLQANGQSILGNPFAFPDTWQTVAFHSSLLVFIPAILIITLVTNEYSYRTHRQNIIDGWSRNQFISVKLFEVFLLSVFVTLVVFLTVLFFGYFQKTREADYFDWKYARYLFYFFVQMNSYSMIAFLCGMLIKRAGLAMGIFFVYMIMEQFVVVILREKYKITKVNYLPEEVTDRLIPLPFGKRMLIGTNREIWEHHISIYLSIAAFYLIIYCIFATWRFRRADL
jgi:ABC-type transport system involved in multi-copper enzyme maturation permease subunit